MTEILKETMRERLTSTGKPSAAQLGCCGPVWCIRIARRPIGTNGISGGTVRKELADKFFEPGVRGATADWHASSHQPSANSAISAKSSGSSRKQTGQEGGRAKLVGGVARFPAADVLGRADEVDMQKRGLTYREAAQRAGVCVTTYRKRVRDGILPGPMPGHGRIDAAALELAMDGLSGIAHSKTEPVSAYDQWKARCDKD